MRVLIVDDEEIIREGLAQVISWCELGLELLQPAASGEEALQRIEQECPSILMTDIRMNGISGLQLCEQAKTILPDLEVIILSGYDDFSYAQTAIRQGVTDYLLKTSPPEDIIRTVLEAKRRIMERWAEKGRDVLQAREDFERKWVKWIVHGEVTEGTIGSLTGGLPEDKIIDHFSSGCKVFILEASGWNGPNYSSRLLLFALRNLLQDLVPSCIYLIHQQALVGLIPAYDAQDLPRYGSWSRLLERAESLLKCSIRMAAGSSVANLEKAHVSYEEAACALRYFPLLPDKIIHYLDIEHRRGGKNIISPEEENQLGVILLDNDPVALKAWTAQLYENLIMDPECTFETTMACLRSAAVAGHRWMDRTFRMLGSEGEIHIDSSLEADGNGFIPEGALFRYLHAIMSSYHSQVSQGPESHVDRAKAFMESVSLREVNLQHVANHLHLHPGHLSELFKKVTGRSFVEFVTELRMKKAEELLSVSPAKLSEIALLIGYEDVKYFSRLFKKHYGLTPSDYRENRSSI
ncbi:helix-turn-helix domain-containing protein [Paenibacillus urinalis]|uniref:Helix-turn-helix domain-containing protein n=1 Tax=Paenibacillus urinalis TaxID=521520 RepID=A0AAX3MS77_9BACL|nr:helix-turn-helix domain-containing protein [Paenibacillus urinalis]WDH80466.1 helix-turn-helix domain-containing protein [Paenibacillus urinalis]